MPIALACALVTSQTARAADVAVSVTDQGGAPAKAAVVTLTPLDGKPAPPPAAVRRIIDQKHEAFVPFVTVMWRNDHLVFKNSDRTRHHVYSFSPIKQFEFVLDPGQTSQPLKFDKAGVVAIGCNIHDQMLAYAVIVQTPWSTLTPDDGRATIAGVPKGKYRASVWHPYLAGDGPADKVIDTEVGAVSFALDLKTPRKSRGHERHY